MLFSTFPAKKAPGIILGAQFNMPILKPRIRNSSRVQYQIDIEACLGKSSCVGSV